MAKHCTKPFIFLEANKRFCILGRSLPRVGSYSMMKRFVMYFTIKAAIKENKWIQSGLDNGFLPETGRTIKHECKTETIGNSGLQRSSQVTPH